MTDRDLNPDVCGCILAGGQSRRMGTNKALIEIGGRTLVEYVLVQLRALTNEICISANEPGPYVSLGRPVIPDHYPGQGPLAGLHACLRQTERPFVILVACDLPGIRAATLEVLYAAADGYDIVLPQLGDDRIHALCGVFHRHCLEPLEQILQANNNKVTTLLADPRLKIRRVTPKEGNFREEEFININSFNDLEEFKARRESF